MVKLFVGGFPLDINELELVKLIAPYGDVITVKIVRDKATGKCKGYAFLEMKEQTGADAAIEALDGAMMDGRQLSVRVAEEKPVKPFRPQQGGYKKPERRSFNSYGNNNNRNSDSRSRYAPPSSSPDGRGGAESPERKKRPRRPS